MKRSRHSEEDTQDDDDRASQRRLLRSKYRDLINTVQQHREDMVNPCDNKLTEVLEEATQLFKDVHQVREAAMDSHLLVVASDLGKEKATQLFSEGLAFDTSVFAEHALSLMGLNRLEDGENDAENGATTDGFLPQDAWHRLANRVECCFRTTPSFHYMNGLFHVEPPPPKPHIERQRKAPSKEAKRMMPTEVKKMQQSLEEATEKEVERILSFLRAYHAQESAPPLCYYEFVIDPESFANTVQNIFHTSFLIRDGLAKMYLDEEKLPCIAPVDDDDVRTSSRKQCVVSICHKSWKELIDVFGIKNALIQPPNTD